MSLLEGLERFGGWKHPACRMTLDTCVYRRSAAVAVLAVVCAVPLRTTAQTPAVDELLNAASKYLEAAIPRLANIVASEDYDQEMPAGRLKRRLTSDVLLVPSPEEPRSRLFFRDVLDVNGRRVSDQQARLIDLFISPTGDATAQVGAISAAGAARHIPGGFPAISNPFIAMALLDPYYRPRLQFTMGKLDKDAGPTTWTLQFRELEPKKTPSSAASPLLATALVRGTAWIELPDGTITRTEIQFGESRYRRVTTTRFRYDPELMVAVPLEMKTTWIYEFGLVNGTAAYRDFRRFGVQTDMRLTLPPK